MIMIPPIVGVPVFFIWPSRPRLRTVSPICLFWSLWMMVCPKKRAHTIAMASEMPERNEM